MTNRCSNRCEFCIRNFGDGIDDSGSLWLDREPTVDEVSISILENVNDCKEIVFCGYGEPVMRLDDLLAVVRKTKDTVKVPFRINTNGQADLIWGRPTEKDLEGLIDTVSISLNAPTAAEYDDVCHSAYGEKAFDAMIEYAKECKKYVPHVKFSVVDCMDKDDIEKCRILSKNAGIELRVRKMIK
jgi:TatD family-associated radical SAM protein